MLEHIQIGNGASLGPDGLRVSHIPSAPTVLSLADIMEALRWVHADLLAVHRAFSSVHALNARMERIERIFDSESSLHASLLREITTLHANVLAHTDRAAGASAALRMELLELLASQELHLLLELQAVESRLSARLSTRWWHRLARWLRMI